MQGDHAILVLAIDTTTEHGSLALQRGEQLLECREVHAHQAFSRVVFAEIRALLERHQTSLREVDLFAAASGPGSFTGVRVGLTAAKGLAAVHGKKVAPVSNLAATASLAPAGPRILIPLLDARRGELFAAVFERAEPEDAHSPLRPLAEELVARPPALAEQLATLRLPPQDTAFCGPEVARLSELVSGGQSALARFARVVTGPALAAAVARLALVAYSGGQVLTAEAADANYVRRSDAEIFQPNPTKGHAHPTSEVRGGKSGR